ncbi:MAG TPA: phosphatase PAP2 family protein [Acidimicrobiales bacterium]|nr:phosphatase PAP2 family protein [Acidimicrobiales bacterium]
MALIRAILVVVTPPQMEPTAAKTGTRVRAPYIHADLPATPSSALRAHPRLLVVMFGVFLALAVAAAMAGSQVLLTWDEPIARWVEAHRTTHLDAVFHTFSRLGSTVPVLLVATAVGIAAWRRCRAVGVALIVATFSKPLVETVLKAVVDRDRPDFDRLVAGHGPSFPSGHVMAAMALWGMLPLVVSLYTRRRDVWWGSVAVAVTIIGGIAASRVYLGVHWFSDVVGGLLAGAIFLVGVQAVFDHQHRAHGCGLCDGHEHDGEGECEDDVPVPVPAPRPRHEVDEPVLASPAPDAL